MATLRYSTPRERTAGERSRILRLLIRYGLIAGAYPVIRLATVFADPLSVEVTHRLVPFSRSTAADGPITWSTGVAIADFWALPVGKLFILASAALLIAGLVMRRAGRDTFLLHALQIMVGVVALNTLITTQIPFEIQGIGSSYLIFFYHFPAAMSCFLFFILLMVCSIIYLRTDDPMWDRVARVSAQIGLLACTIVVTTGSTWASVAWNAWWVWDDPRLVSAAVMWLTYAGYVMLQIQLDDPYKRRRFCAVFGILASINIPAVHYAIKWFGGVKSHPMQFEDMKSDPWITFTRWFGVLVFIGFYALLFRWRLSRESTRDRLQESLWRVRRLEEGAGA